MKNLLMNFEGNSINFILGENGEPLFEMYSVGQAIGYEKSKIVKGKEYKEIRKDRINQVIKNAEIEPIKIEGQRYLTEDMVYDFIFEAKTDRCKTFRKWLSNDILPQLRKEGVVILDHASDENIDFEKKFGKYRVRRTFTESQDLRKDWEQLKELSKEKKLDGTNRLKLYNITFDSVQNRLNNNLTELRGSELLAMQELLTEIKSDTLELSNRVNGGKKSNLTRKLNIAQEQLVEAQDTIRYIRPENEDYYYMDIHGFTVNRMYEPNTNEFDMIRKDFKDRGTLRKTTAYKAWIEDFNIEMDKLDLDIDFTNGVDIYLYFDHMSKFDAHNFHKSFFDCFANYYGVDDRNFHLKVCDTNYFVDSYEEGRIYFCIRERETE